jgi:cell division protein FtsW
MTTAKIPKTDRLFFLSVLALVIAGFFIFSSASLGLLTNDKENFGDVFFHQIFFGIFLGSIGLIIFSRLNYKILRKYAFYIFLFSACLTFLVFLPQLGFSHGGARRWIDLKFLTFQPAEFLKIGYVLYLAAWFSKIKNKMDSKEYYSGLLPFLVASAIAGLILYNQPDIGTLMVIASAGFAIFVTAGARWRDIILIVVVGLVSFSAIAFTKPYVMERINTLFNPSEDILGNSYQLEQSLIAIGSGEMFGRGPGLSVQKFSFLPEPIGDSIFAVAAEEFGFVGSVFLVLLFLFFAFRGLRIASRSPDTFSGLLTVGIVILIISQSFINMASMLGIIPLSGMPLIFISHGGTALFFALSSVGIILNISRYQKKF